MVTFVKISISGNNLTDRKRVPNMSPPFQKKPVLFGLHLPLEYNAWKPSFLKVFKETHIPPLQTGIPTIKS